MEVVVGLQHPLARQAAVGWPALQDYPWVVPPVATLMHGRLDSARVAEGISIMPRVESGSITMVQALLRSTDYVSVLAGQVACQLQARGVLRMLPMRGGAQVFGQIGVVWDAGNAAPLLWQFVEALREQARALSDEAASP